MRLLGYTELFRDLARRHVDLQATEANNRFMRVRIAADPIAQQLDLQEFYSALRSRLKAPNGQAIFVLQNYQLDYGDNGGDYFTRQPQGAFYVLRKEKLGGHDGIDVAIEACEAIAEEVLAAVVHLQQATYRVKISVADAFAEHVGPVADGYFGVRMNFTWSETATQDLTYNPAKFST
jgi:hypothetical protein